jgi:hypothetical protein
MSAIPVPPQARSVLHGLRESIGAGLPGKPPVKARQVLVFAQIYDAWMVRSIPQLSRGNTFVVAALTVTLPFLGAAARGLGCTVRSLSA